MGHKERSNIILLINFSNLTLVEQIITHTHMKREHISSRINTRVSICQHIYFKGFLIEYFCVVSL